MYLGKGADDGALFSAETDAAIAGLVRSVELYSRYRQPGQLLGIENTVRSARETLSELTKGSREARTLTIYIRWADGVAHDLKNMGTFSSVALILKSRLADRAAELAELAAHYGAAAGESAEGAAGAITKDTPSAIKWVRLAAAATVGTAIVGYFALRKKKK
jgi:hypothetical protein